MTSRETKKNDAKFRVLQRSARATGSMKELKKGVGNDLIDLTTPMTSARNKESSRPISSQEEHPSQVAMRATNEELQSIADDIRN